MKTQMHIFAVRSGIITENNLHWCSVQATDGEIVERDGYSGIQIHKLGVADPKYIPQILKNLNGKVPADFNVTLGMKQKGGETLFTLVDAQPLDNDSAAVPTTTKKPPVAAN